ncbi:1-phosphofructokinase family hexose kinase [Nocardioides mangrovicus]|uniref:1-phosphofructokinase family hexose kinase n=1 Tax=Nocardioides mangrovicus TaxID=2478913 RepID=A0A3L8P2U7_9ACTN|nr:1-phosphofructokinase family hexose kinase [Nocardioides mangrovicus]RLV48889.1 1-phosphofructokinase family hexose kinase [Nocardioides mangrovicus]
MSASGTQRPSGLIVTLTPNPSTDRTIQLAGPLERGGVMRAAAETAQAGGKGINISRAAVAAGVRTLAVLPADPDDPFVHDLLRDGIDTRPQPPSGPIRGNVTITEPDGTTTKLNSPGPTATAASLDALGDALLSRAATASWIVLAGSLPPGAPPQWYAELVAALHDMPAQVAVDTSDRPLAELVARLPGSAPDLMKPNGAELASLTGADPELTESDPRAAADAARRLLDRGVGAVLATLGANGAVLVSAEGCWHATPPPTTVVSTVGAGDSSLFGYLLADLRHGSPPERLAQAVAYGSAAASLPGTTIPRPDQTRPDLVTVHRLDPTAAHREEKVTL